MTLGIQKNIDISKVIIYPNILVNRYLYFIIPFPYIIPLLYSKQAYFVIFLSTHGHNFIYKANTITTISEFVEHCNEPVVLNLSVQSLYPSQSSVIVGIDYAPISYEDKIHQPIKHTDFEDPYKNLEISLHYAGFS